MISGIDIEDMRESRSTNHVGWEAQCLSKKGWISQSVIFISFENALKAVVSLEENYPNDEFRVYEVVK